MLWATTTLGILGYFTALLNNQNNVAAEAVTTLLEMQVRNELYKLLIYEVTPISTSKQYFTALKLQGVESAMVRIPNASHGLVNRPSMLMSKSAAILSWFNHYLDKK